MKKYKKGEIITFRDMRQYEVLQVHDSGLLVAEILKTFQMSPTHFFSNVFLESAEKKSFFSAERKK